MLPPTDLAWAQKYKKKVRPSDAHKFHLANQYGVSGSGKRQARAMAGKARRRAARGRQGRWREKR